MTKEYSGQWEGFSEGGSYCIANLDERKAGVSGRVSLLEHVVIDGQEIPYFVWSSVKAEKEEDRLLGKVHPPTIHNEDGVLYTQEQLNLLKSKVPDFELATSTVFKGRKISVDVLEIEWASKYQSGLTRNDTVRLKRKRKSGSRVRHRYMSWSEFKGFALRQHGGMIYRGQARRWRLQTAFHRTGRSDLVAYLDNEVPELEKYINIHSKHLYDATNDRSLGAMLYLAQHHGYPTPLLDWTRSPYVAAFFAFENALAHKPNGKVSIFMFDEERWSEMAGRYAPLRTPRHILRTLDLPGYGNARVLPQQSITMYSNVDDIEHIIFSNKKGDSDFIESVAISMRYRDEAMHDLSLMGITWGSLFPGLDGVCRQLRENHFN